MTKLTYTGPGKYNGRGERGWANGETREVSDELADALLQDFPERFEPAYPDAGEPVVEADLDPEELDAEPEAPKPAAKKKKKSTKKTGKR